MPCRFAAHWWFYIYRACAETSIGTFITPEKCKRYKANALGGPLKRGQYVKNIFYVETWINDIAKTTMYTPRMMYKCIMACLMRWLRWLMTKTLDSPSSLCSSLLMVFIYGDCHIHLKYTVNKTKHFKVKSG